MPIVRKQAEARPGRRYFDGTKLHDLRVARGYTRPQFAAVTEIPISMLVEYDRGRALPSVDRLFLLADTLGVKVEDLTSVAA